jgi:TPR repeat protein
VEQIGHRAFARTDGVCLLSFLAPSFRVWTVVVCPATRGTIMNFHASPLAASLSLTLLSLLAIPQHTRAASQSPQAVASPSSDLVSRAEQGDSAAQYQLATSILEEHPSPGDIQTALTLLRASAAQNNPRALLYVGYLYEHGKFVTQDYAQAVRNYEPAARAHYPPAENNLGFLYQHGVGIAKDLDKAFEWYRAGANHGDPVAQFNLATFYYLGTATSRDYAEAVRWLRLSADSGLADAQNNLASFYFHGIGVPRDYTEAARLLRLAVQQGLPTAETSLGFLYEHGKGVPVDYVAAYTWYSLAAAAGDSSGSKRRKRLAQIMTRMQLDEATSLVATQTAGPASPSSSAIFSLYDR